jgi:two-component system sensor histidine kinase TctE
MQHSNLSLRKKILTWLMPLMLLLIFVDSSLLHRLAVHALEKQLDADLSGSAKAIAAYLNRSGIEAQDFEMLENASKILLNDEIDTVMYSVTDASGHLLSGNQYLAAATHRVNSMRSPKLFFTEVNGVQYRVVRSAFNLKHAAVTHKLNIQVAATLNRRNMLADEILVGIVLPQLLLVLVTFFIISIGVKKGLAPLQELHNAVSRRSEQNLSPIDLPNIPEEVSLVARSVNQLMQQLQSLILGQNRFIADAAHQLRTPLAGAQAQLELAELETDPLRLKSILAKVNQSLDRLSHTIDQLLVLAKSQPEAVSMMLMEVLDLNLISKEVASQMVPAALQKQIDLGFEQSQIPAMITGNAERLREMLYNLLDNAIRYTQNRGQVTMSVHVTDTAVDLHLIDNGPGVSVNERDKIFDRFHRIVGSGQEGSGLGLAIVKEIAKLHGASITVGDAHTHSGLQIVLSFSRQSVLL